jgi:hypothetical protein
MNQSTNSIKRPRISTPAKLSAAALAMGLAYGSAVAQPGEATRDNYPQLAELFNAFDVTQAQTFDEIQKINTNPYAKEARDSLAEHLTMMANMTMKDMMAAGMGHGDGMHMGMDMSSPYGDLEVEARINLRNTLRGSHSDDAAAAAFESSDALDRHTAEIFQHGRRFENALFAIYADESISDKRAAIAAAVEEYQADTRHAVASTPKDTALLITHPQANAFKTAFPRLSGFLWTQQWLQLAALEAVIRDHVDPEFNGGIDIALERFENKIGSAGGMSMYPAPTELPMAAAIAPDLYSQSPEATIIIDNLNVLETIVADIMSYPNLEQREELIEAVTSRFTDNEASNVAPEDYLLFALRGGIYNQGGPAVGELSQSERNRSRSAMDMQHAMVMGNGPQ